MEILLFLNNDIKPFINFLRSEIWDEIYIQLAGRFDSI